ncbi:hypothetical protein ACS0TY_022668 [Phlomoides rotata]
MQDFIGSVRRSLVFKSSGEEPPAFGGIVDRVGSSIRNSRIGLFARPPVHALPPPRRNAVTAGCLEEEGLPPMAECEVEEEARVVADNNAEILVSEDIKRKEVLLPPPIRWRKGELIGCGAFGRVYMGMNLDSGELLAVKEVAISANTVSKKTQEYISELEKEVDLLKNLSHPNIVRYLGTAREKGSLNILLEFVPGGSISSLLGKFGSFPESVIRMYTKQLLIGLEYLHENKIMHRDIKGANILVDNKACIKLADFGASKKVEALVTVTGAKSMKGTPYWMAPEVIVQSGHSFSADIWSVGCTIIEMATGKAPWSQQYQEVAALFHVGTTKSHPPIPEHLSTEAKDFLLKCLQKEPDLRSTSSELLKHPFVTGEHKESHLTLRHSVVRDGTGKRMADHGIEVNNTMKLDAKRSCNGLRNVGNLSGTRCSSVHPDRFSTWKPVSFDDDMCRINDDDDLVLGESMKFTSTMVYNDCNESFNPMRDPDDDWPCSTKLFRNQTTNSGNAVTSSCVVDLGFTSPGGQPVEEDDDEVIEWMIRAFLDEKAFELKKLQTPLYEFYNSSNVAGSNKENINVSSNCNLPPKKSKSPTMLGSRRLSSGFDVECRMSPARCSRRASNIGDVHSRASQDVKELLNSQRLQKKWEEELAEEIKRTREFMRREGAAARSSSSPNYRVLLRHRDRLRLAYPGN